MKKRMVRITGCLLAGALSIGSFGLNTYAAPVAGVSSVTAAEIAEGQTPAAGVSQALAQCLADSNDAAAQAAAEQAEQVSENETPVVASEYTDIAIAQVDNYVNVRSEPNTDSEVLGKLYNNSAGTILETTDNGWYRIKSGNVDGYVNCEYVVPNDEELAKKVSTKYAKVNTTTLHVRTEPSTDASILTMVPVGDDLVVTDDESVEGWAKVTTEEGDGWVHKDYVDITIEFVQAESKAEEKARLAKEEAEREAADAAANAARKKADGKLSSSKNSGSSKSYAAAGSSNGQAVASYASQFIGNPYVYGGTSLTNGADCSGFVMSVFSHFGINTGRSSREQAGKGKTIPVDQVQPGDLLFYASGDYINHVGIYVGDGKIIHSSNPATGICYASANYRTPCKAVSFFD